MDEILDVAPLRRLAVSSTTADLLVVLTLLEALNRLGPGLAAEAAISQGKAAEGGVLEAGLVPRAEFVSNKLAPKLAQQLKVRGPSACHASNLPIPSQLPKLRSAFARL